MFFLTFCRVFPLCWEFCSECWRGCQVSCHTALLLQRSKFCRRHWRLCREIMKTDTMLYFHSYVLRVLQWMVAIMRCQLLYCFLLKEFCKECCKYVMSRWFTPPSQFCGGCWWLCSEDGELCWWLLSEDGELCWWLCSEDSELIPHWFTYATLIYLPQCSELCGECWWLRSEDGEQPAGHADQRSTLSHQPHPGAGQPHTLHLFFFVVSFFFISFSSSFFFRLVFHFDILKTDTFGACWVIQWFHNPPNSDLDYRM